MQWLGRLLWCHSQWSFVNISWTFTLFIASILLFSLHVLCPDFAKNSCRFFFFFLLVLVVVFFRVTSVDICHPFPVIHHAVVYCQSFLRNSAMVWTAPPLFISAALDGLVMSCIVSQYWNFSKKWSFQDTSHVFFWQL